MSLLDAQFDGGDFHPAGFQRIGRPPEHGGKRLKVDKGGIRALSRRAEQLNDLALTHSLMTQGLARLKVGPRGVDSANEFAARTASLSDRVEELKTELAGAFAELTTDQRNAIFKLQEGPVVPVRQALKLAGITSAKPRP